MRLLTLQSLFSTSPSTVSFSPDDCAPSVSTTLGYSTLASDEAVSIRARQPGEAVEEAGGSHCRARLNDSACESLRPACTFVLPLSLPIWLLRLWSWTACCCNPGGTASFFPPAKKRGEKKTKKRGEKINSSLKEFVKAASEGVQHLLWHRRQAHVTLRMLGFTWQITRVPVRKKVLLLSWLIDRSWLARRAHHNANQCQDVCLCEHWQDDWIYFSTGHLKDQDTLINPWMALGARVILTTFNFLHYAENVQ